MDTKPKQDFEPALSRTLAELLRQWGTLCVFISALIVIHLSWLLYVGVSPKARSLGLWPSQISEFSLELVRVFLPMAISLLIFFLLGKYFGPFEKFLASLDEEAKKRVAADALMATLAPFQKGVELTVRSSITSETTTILQELRKGVLEAQHLPAFLSGYVPHYNDVDWSEMLAGATDVFLCFRYCNADWLARNSSKFTEWFAPGRKLRVVLQDPRHPGLSRRLLGPERYANNKGVTESVDQTAAFFLSLRKKEGTKIDDVRVEATNVSIPYMFGRIKRQSKTEFFFSPFILSKTSGNSDPPFVRINLDAADSATGALVEMEIAKFADEDTQPYPLYEGYRHLTRDSDLNANRIFVSSSLKCNAACSYCYINSLVGHEENRGAYEPAMILPEIVHHKRFQKGPEGTKIFFGAFSDPFGNDRDTEVTLRLLEELAPYGNVIHIATKFAPVDQCETLGKYWRTAMVNISVAGPRNTLEKGTKPFAERLEFARQLRAKRVKIGLYVRPVIPTITRGFLQENLDAIKEVTFDCITVGGLYKDAEGAISKRLNPVVSVDSFGVEARKRFVLDQKRDLDDSTSTRAPVLSKLSLIQEISQVRSLFDASKSHICASSTEALEFFSRNLPAN